MVVLTVAANAVVLGVAQAVTAVVAASEASPCTRCTLRTRCTLVARWRNLHPGQWHSKRMQRNPSSASARHCSLALMAAAAAMAVVVGGAAD